MSHIDTLKEYKALLECGFPPSQAEGVIKQLNASFDNVVTQKDLKILENDLKIFFSWIVGGTLILALIIPIISKLCGLI